MDFKDKFSKLNEEVEFQLDYMSLRVCFMLVEVDELLKLSLNLNLFLLF